MAEAKHECTSCGATSSDRLLISCEQNGKAVWVCARCLPMFIHGSH